MCFYYFQKILMLCSWPSCQYCLPIANTLSEVTNIGWSGLFSLVPTRRWMHVCYLLSLTDLWVGSPLVSRSPTCHSAEVQTLIMDWTLFGVCQSQVKPRAGQSHPSALSLFQLWTVWGCPWQLAAVSLQLFQPQGRACLFVQLCLKEQQPSLLGPSAVAL